MNNNTNEDGDFPRTGTPAHNNTTPRDVDSVSLSDKYPVYVPNSACMECGGEGMIWQQVANHTRDGETEIDYENYPCECIFREMTAKPDKKCRACYGTGEVEESHIINNDKVTTYYACICLRYVPIDKPEESDNYDKE
tara:strand:- start:230 stop:643 length:414 start_codon:yes stop_codon:yes gene_type:complete